MYRTDHFVFQGYIVQTMLHHIYIQAQQKQKPVWYLLIFDQRKSITNALWHEQETDSSKLSATKEM